MTIVIYFHCMGLRNFKTYYLGCVCRHLSSEFPTTVSYNRFVERMAKVLIPLCIYMRFRLGVCTGISFVDATQLRLLVAGLIAHSFRPKKPSLNLSDSELATLPALISFPN